MKKGTIVVEEYENPFLRTYHVTEEISHKPETTFDKPFCRTKSFEEMNKLGDLGKDIVMRFAMIPGVECIKINPYSITVRIGKAFLFGDEGTRRVYTPSSIHFVLLDILIDKVFDCKHQLVYGLSLVNIAEGKEAESRLSGFRK